MNDPYITVEKYKINLKNSQEKLDDGFLFFLKFSEKFLNRALPGDYFSVFFSRDKNV